MTSLSFAVDSLSRICGKFCLRLLRGILDPKSSVGGGSSPPRVSLRRPGDASFYLLLFDASGRPVIHRIRREKVQFSFVPRGLYDRETLLSLFRRQIPGSVIRQTHRVGGVDVLLNILVLLESDSRVILG